MAVTCILLPFTFLDLDLVLVHVDHLIMGFPNNSSFHFFHSLIGGTFLLPFEIRLQGHLGDSDVKHLPLAEVMVLGS